MNADRSRNTPLTVKKQRYDSPLGPLMVAAQGGAVVGLWFVGQAHYGMLPHGLAPLNSLPAAEEAVFAEAEVWLKRFFCGVDPGRPPLLRLAGTTFQNAVWQLLTEIPRGKVRTYGELAATLGSSARAVGGAIARNPISLMIPCHRVIGAGGQLTGYAGGVDRKARLLALEQTRG